MDVNIGMFDFFTQTILPSFHDMKPYGVYKKTWGETVFESRHNENPSVQNMDYRLNNYGHRSDDFVKTHEGLHVLFAGCSFTFGESLPYKQNWSGKLYEKMKDVAPLDNYFALAFMNGVTSNIIYNILLYCKEFGNPEIIFCLFPDAVRKVDFVNDGFVIDYKFDKYHSELGRLDCLKSITFLEEYCEALGIKLVWSTWSGNDTKVYSKLKFKNFVFLEDVDVFMNAKNKHESDDPFYKIGRDGDHPGLQYSDGVANIFFDNFKKNYDV